MTVMGKPFEEKPPEWSPIDNWIDAGGDIYYVVVEGGIEVGSKASNVWIYHWHTPTNGAQRWAISACGLHDVLSVDPLTLSPSLACDDGCPSHGYIEQGKWRSV